MNRSLQLWHEQEALTGYYIIIERRPTNAQNDYS